MVGVLDRSSAVRVQFYVEQAGSELSLGFVLVRSHRLQIDDLDFLMLLGSRSAGTENGSEKMNILREYMARQAKYREIKRTLNRLNREVGNTTARTMPLEERVSMVLGVLNCSMLALYVILWWIF
jgi:hypothetical protein